MIILFQDTKSIRSHRDLPEITISLSSESPQRPSLGASRTSSEVSEGPATPSGMIMFGSRSQKGLSLKASRENLKKGLLGQDVGEVSEGVEQLRVE
jgi:hypothetical protein